MASTSNIRKNMISLIKKKKQARNEKPGAGLQSFPAPVLYIAWPRFRFYGHGLFLLQENNVQDDTDQHAGRHPSDYAGEHQQNGRDAGEAQDNGHRTQHLPEIFQPPRRPQSNDKGAKGTCIWAYSYVSISVHAARGGLRS